MRLEQPRVLLCPADERLPVPARQDRRDRMAGALAHLQGGEDSLGGQRVEGDGGVARGDPAVAGELVEVRDARIDDGWAAVETASGVANASRM